MQNMSNGPAAAGTATPFEISAEASDIICRSLKRQCAKDERAPKDKAVKSSPRTK